jgi:hypothetical protein
MNSFLLDPQLKSDALAALSGLPPAEYLARCTTKDQALWLFELKLLYEQLYEAFKAYFEGRASQHELISLQHREFFELLRDWYLSWYNCVQLNWKTIEAEAVKRDLPLPDSPGAALIAVLQLDAEAFCQPAFQPYYRATPHQTRTLYQQDLRIREVLASGKKVKTPQLKKYQSQGQGSRWSLLSTSERA